MKARFPLYAKILFWFFLNLLLLAGVAFVVTDREQMNAVDVGLTLALILQRLYPKDFALAKFNTLLQHPATIEATKAGKSLAEIKQSWAGELAAFQKRRAPFLLYA